MFIRKADGKSAGPESPRLPVPAGRTAVASAPMPGRPSLIAADLLIQGDLATSGEIHIDGEVQGEVRAEKIVVGKHGFVSGTLIAHVVVVEGSAQGSVRGNEVLFRSGSQIEGDVFHKSLTIEQGAYFEGKSRRADDPMSIPAEPVRTEV